MRIEIPENNFDTFLFAQAVSQHANSEVDDFCAYTAECYIHGLLVNVVYSNDFIDLNDALSVNINNAIWQIINNISDDIMSVPDDYNKHIVDFFHKHTRELNAVLYMTLIQAIDGVVRFIPEILNNATKSNVIYDDFRLTTDSNRYILRLIRKPQYVY